MTAPLDILVVGGGINGAAIACDAAGRGASVALCEERDFAEGTSSRSSKLIHGGLRYLETYDFKLVRDALIEREILMKKAPHLVRPIRLVLPHVPSQRPRWMIRLGLFLYDHLARRETLPGSEALNLRAHEAGMALKDSYLHAFAYSDCRGDDSRLVIANLLGAQRHGAEILARHRFERAERADGLWRITLKNMGTGGRISRAARVLINAAGPWVTRVAGTIKDTAVGRTLRMVRGSHIVVPRQWAGDHGYYFQTADGRTMEAFPYEEDFLSIGTTDAPWTDEPQNVAMSDDEAGYMLREVNTFFRKPVTRSDTVWSYSGVRPLFESGGGRDGDLKTLTRDYAFEIDANGPPLLTVFGGKLTTHRKLAEHAMEKLAPHVSFRRPGITRTEVLPGGERFELPPWLSPSLARRYARTYGSRSGDLLKGMSGPAHLGADLGGGLHERELEFLRATEWAVTADDVIWRRTKLGLRMTGKERDALAGRLT